MFLNIKADSGDRSPWGGFWFEPVPWSGGSANVTADAALQLTAVYACIRNVSEDTSTLPFVMKKVGKDGKKTVLKDHWLYRLIAKRPNEYQTPMEFREMMQGHLELRGNAFAEIYANSKGEVTDLIPHHPDRITIEMLSDANWRYVVKRLDGTEYRLSRAEMFHIKGLSGNGITGYSPIQIARKAVSTGLAAQDYGMRFFENDAKPGGWIEYPGQFKDDEKRRQWRAQWQEQQAGRNKHKTAVLEFGMKYHELTLSNEDAQFIKTKENSRSEIASMWRMPPHMIGDLARSTNNNIEHQSLEYVIYSIRPRCIRWEEAIRFSFLDPEDDSIEIEFSMLALLRGDLAARGTYINTRILNGSMTRNEGRLMEGDEPLDGLDEPLRPLNMVEESDAELLEGDDAAGKPTNPDQSGQSALKLAAIRNASAARLARRAAGALEKKTSAEVFDDDFAALIAEAMAVPIDSAAQWCSGMRAFPTWDESHIRSCLIGEFAFS